MSVRKLSDSLLTVCLNAGYEHNPEPLNPRFQEVFDMVDSSNVGTHIVMMLPKVAEAQPQVSLLCGPTTTGMV